MVVVLVMVMKLVLVDAWWLNMCSIHIINIIGNGIGIGIGIGNGNGNGNGIQVPPRLVANRNDSRGSQRMSTQDSLRFVCDSWVQITVICYDSRCKLPENGYKSL